MPRRIAARVRRDIPGALQRRADHHHRLPVHFHFAARLRYFLLALGSCRKPRADPMRQRLRNRRPRRQRHIQKQQRRRTVHQRSARRPLPVRPHPRRLQCRRHGRCVQNFQQRAVAQHFHLLQRRIAAGKIRHPQLIRHVRAAIGTGKGNRRILHRQQQRRHHLTSSSSLTLPLAPSSRAQRKSCKGKKSRNKCRTTGKTHRAAPDFVLFFVFRS